jgi:hypothetical protein
MDLFSGISTSRLIVISSMAKGIQLGMHRSVENRYRPVLHPVRDASLGRKPLPSYFASLTGCIAR